MLDSIVKYAFENDTFIGLAGGAFAIFAIILIYSMIASIRIPQGRERTRFLFRILGFSFVGFLVVLAISLFFVYMTMPPPYPNPNPKKDCFSCVEKVNQYQTYRTNLIKRMVHKYGNNSDIVTELKGSYNLKNFEGVTEEEIDKAITDSKIHITEILKYYNEN